MHVLTQEWFIESTAFVEHPWDLLEVEKESGDDVEAVDQAQGQQEAPSDIKTEINI